MTDYEYAQVVMKAAGAGVHNPPLCQCGHAEYAHLDGDGICMEHPCHCAEFRFWDRGEFYLDPLTPGGFHALWDALEAKGWRVEFRTLSDGTLAQVYKADEMGRPDLGSISQGGHEDRRVAFVDAAGKALGVTR